jgi:hypothetical protein
MKTYTTKRLNDYPTCPTRLFVVGIFLAIADLAGAGVHYVDANNTNATAPYTNWSSAARSIQDAVDAALAGDEIVVTNGTYGGVVVDKLLTLWSVNGAAVTTIDGGGTSRCVYLRDGTSLSGFTLTNGFDYSRGGGLVCETTNALVSNCLLTGNAVFGRDGWDVYGGGAYGGTLNNCVLKGNWAYASDCPYQCIAYSAGGGAYGATLNNCTLTGNSVQHSPTGPGLTGWAIGGGAFACTLNNCIAFGNYNDGGFPPTCEDCEEDPLFVDLAGGNLRLQSNSPCINAGNNAFAPPGSDLDGNRRIVGGTVDLGAYEFQSPTSVISYAWLRQYNLLTDGSADFADPDGDGLNNWQEWRCGTDPTNALSALRLLSPVAEGTTVTVTWQSVAGVTYFLEGSTTLERLPAFIMVAKDILGQPNTTTYTDTHRFGAGPWFYRVGVSVP